MSYDIYLKEGENICNVPRFNEGGVQVLGGETKAHINITYNYSFFYRWFLDKRKGIRWLYGKKAKDTIPRLEKAIDILVTNGGLGSEPSDDYWSPTHGNAGHALKILLSWAKQHPEAIWEGD